MFTPFLASLLVSYFCFLLGAVCFLPEDNEWLKGNVRFILRFISHVIFYVITIFPDHININVHYTDICITGHCQYSDHLCGLVVRVPDYRFKGPGLIPGATRFSEK
jgi:hypothetical protein